MPSWTVGPFAQGDIVRAKDGHPFRDYGWGVVVASLAEDTVGVLFPGAKEWIPFQVQWLESFAKAEVPRAFSDAFGDAPSS